MTRRQDLHPLIHLIYTAGAIVLTLLLKHPACAFLSFAAAFALSVRAAGKKALLFDLFMIPFPLLWTVCYAAFHHFGVTPLAVNRVGNSITLESVLCGLIMGLQIAAVMIELVYFFTVFSTDKVVYLFGRLSPRLSLYLSILFRLIPDTVRTSGRYVAARKGIGKGRRYVLSATVTQMLDAHARTAMSMRARGYGLSGRTAYALFPFEMPERIRTLLLSVLIIICVSAHALGFAHAVYNPQISVAPPSLSLAAFLTLYGLFLLSPELLNMRKGSA